MLKTTRLILRRFTEADAEDVFEYLHEPAVSCFACMKLDTIDDARKAVAERADDELYYAIVLKDSGKVIGEIFSHPEGTSPEDEVMDTFSPCWMLNLNYSGKGYAYEAACAYFEHLFSEKGARRLYAYTEDYNIPGQHLCERLGMRREGLFMPSVKEDIAFFQICNRKAAARVRPERRCFCYRLIVIFSSKRLPDNTQVCSQSSKYSALPSIRSKSSFPSNANPPCRQIPRPTQ